MPETTGKHRDPGRLAARQGNDPRTAGLPQAIRPPMDIYR